MNGVFCIWSLLLLRHCSVYLSAAARLSRESNHYKQHNHDVNLELQRNINTGTQVRYGGTVDNSGSGGDSICVVAALTGCGSAAGKAEAGSTGHCLPLPASRTIGVSFLGSTTVTIQHFLGHPDLRSNSFGISSYLVPLRCWCWLLHPSVANVCAELRSVSV